MRGVELLGVVAAGLREVGPAAALAADDAGDLADRSPALQPLASDPSSRRARASPCPRPSTATSTTPLPAGRADRRRASRSSPPSDAVDLAHEHAHAADLARLPTRRLGRAAPRCVARRSSRDLASPLPCARRAASRRARRACPRRHAQQLADAAQRPLLRAHVRERAEARQRLDAAHARGDARLARRS